MVFSSPIFLFLFLPIVLGLYALTPRSGKNLVLLSASLFFYAWGETFFVFVMLVSIAANYVLGLCIECSPSRKWAKMALISAVIINLGLLGSYKYANFFADNLNSILGVSGIGPLSISPVHLPIGISFFTFQALSYVIDVYRKEVRAQRNVINIGLYIALFPQLIAGPIVRYHDVAKQILKRVTTRQDLAEGIKRFIIGLGKKVLIANTLAVPADQIFSVAPYNLPAGVAWFAILCYTLQIYYDFSGYSDMAIGLGRMFGFRFLENFNYPYISKSIREFWRRWHISLSSWFRDYLYIPLGGSHGQPWRVYFNLVTVFFLCGLWHGASWNFVIWGLFHGAFLVIERLKISDKLKTCWPPLQHVYVLLVVIVGWVFFRIEGFKEALYYLAAMVGYSEATGSQYTLGIYLNAEILIAFLAGVIGSLPVMPLIRKSMENQSIPSGSGVQIVSSRAIQLAHLVLPMFILAASLLNLAAGTYNPFIYFRF